MISEELIIGLVEEFVGDGPLFLVDVHVGAGNKISIEIDADLGVGINDCVKTSKFVESHLDREAEDFELLVSSAGVGRPLKIKRQYQKNIGKEVTLRTKSGEEYEGKVVSVGDKLALHIPANKKKKTPEMQIDVDWDSIKECKVIISFK